jgi:uncharacterized protein YbcC (UPF0753/DUF2309 family)
LAALPGWTGYINYRAASNSQWQQEYPISLTDYLAVLWLQKKQMPPFIPKVSNSRELLNSELHYIWLKAWEKSYKTQLLTILNQKKVTCNIMNKTRCNWFLYRHVQS